MEVEVSCVVPAADVQIHTGPSNLEIGMGFLRLHISVEIIAGSSHLGIVHVADVMPYTTVKHVFVYAEDGGFAAAVSHHVCSGLIDVGEIGFRVVVPEELSAPFLYLDCLD